MAEALALRAAYVQVVETAVRLTRVLHSPEFRHLVTLLKSSRGLKLNIVGQDNTDVFFEDEQRI